MIKVTRRLEKKSKRKDVPSNLNESAKQFFLDLTEHPRVGASIIQDARIVFANQALADILGYGVTELVAFSRDEIVRLIHPDDREQALGLLQIDLNGKVIQPKYEFRLFKKNGEVCQLEHFPLKIEYFGKPALQTISIDISDTKKREEDLRKSGEATQAILDAADESVFLTDKNGIVLALNETTAKRLGKRAEEVKGRCVFNFLPPAVAAVRKAYCDEVLKSRKAVRLEDERQGRRFETNIYPVLARNGGVTMFAFYARDITGRLEARKALLESEERYKSLFDRSLDCVYIHDFKGKLIDANDATLNLIGYAREEMPSLKLTSFLSEDQIPLLRQTLQEIKKTGQQRGTTEFRLKRKNGEYVEVETNASLLCRNGEPYAIQGIARDISERKQIERALRASEERFRQVFNQMESCVAIYEAVNNGEDFIFKDFNPSAERTERIAKKDLLGRSVSQVFPGIKEFGLLDVFRRVWRTGNPESCPVRLYKDARISGWKENYVCRIPSGEILAIYYDATRQRQSAEALRRNEIRFRAIFENSVDPIGVSKAGIHVLANPAYLKLFGYSLNGELVGKPILNLIAPEQRRRIKENFRLRAERQEAPRSYETRGLRKDGSEFDMDVHVSTHEMDNEVFTVAVVRDITDQKAKENALRASEERYRQLFDNVPVGLYRSTPAGQNLDANPALVKMLGYPDLKSYLDLDSVSDYLNPQDRERWITQMDSHGVVEDFELQVKRRDGSVIWVKNSARAIKDEHGRVVHYEGAFIDITERKLAEKALMESEERFRSLFENATIGLYRTTPDGQILLSNPALIRMLGFRSFSDLARRNLEIGGYEPNYPRSEFRLQIENEGVVRGYESAWTRQDGTTIFVRESAKAIRDKTGRALYYEGTVEDITESRLAGLKLEESYGKLQRAMSGVVQAMASTVEWRDPYTAGHQRRVADLARAIATEMALPQDKIEGIYMAGVIHDIGKISVPAEILSKPGTINENEFALIKSHPKVAYEILKEIEFPWPIAEIVLEHHERLDGSGYPRGLLAEEILIEARILSVADVVEAMATHRPYRPAHGIDKALNEISQKKGSSFDPEAVEACLRLFGEKRFEFEKG